MYSGAQLKEALLFAQTEYQRRLTDQNEVSYFSSS